jgi:hypothetical protein
MSMYVRMALTRLSFRVAMLEARILILSAKLHERGRP